MSIDEVMASIIEYGIEQRRATINESIALRASIKVAIEQHVAEAVAREREGCAKACEDVATTQWDEYAASYNSAVFDCAAAIRARADKETSNG